MHKLDISCKPEKFLLSDSFTISRSKRNIIKVLKVTISDGIISGYGECTPNKRYNQSISGETQKIKEIAKLLNNKFDCDNIKLLEQFDPSPARSAVDNAIWDYKLKKINKSIWEYLKIEKPDSIKTMATIDISSLEKMLTKANKFKEYKTFKIKLKGILSDFKKLTKIREAYPKKNIIVDANEAISPENLMNYISICENLKIEMIEQPMKPEFDKLLGKIKSKIIFCADESCKNISDILGINNYYGAINIKLDKAGGLSDALNMCHYAKENDLLIMTGCMMCTSLGIAPAQILATYSNYVDLDAPLFLAEDRNNGISYESGRMLIAKKILWG
ncbi:MAG: dipeptide epimerase [Hyphomicrobiales bacterium]|jgi:L-Ala-D/L-Glu epimerase|nr:dipeptide epimerase [Hyphomicrobiales bacterium]